MNSAAATTVSSASRPPGRFLLFLALAVVLVMWSVNYIAAKIALAHFDALTLAAFRIVFAVPFILPIYLLQRRRTPLRRRDIWLLIWCGFFGVVVNRGGFIIGLAYTTAGHSSVILAIGPILILLLACAMKLEALTPGKIFGMALSFAGVAILAVENGLQLHSATLAGDLITIAGTSGFAIWAVLSKKLAGVYDTVSMNFYNLLVGAIIVLPLAVRQGMYLDWGRVGWAGWAALLYITVISSVAAYLLFYWALQHMDASRVAATNYFQPVGTILLAAAFLGERPTAYLLAGAAFVLLGVYLAERHATTT